MRKISKALLYPPGGDQQDVRPRGVSGGTITSGSGPQEIDLVTLFAKPADQATIAGAGSTPGPVTAVDKPAGGDKPTGGDKAAGHAPDAAPVIFASPNQFAIVATV